MRIPQPRETPTNAPLLSAWREHGALQLQRCEDCSKAVFYPRSSCPHCHSPKLNWFRAEGCGRIIAFSRIHRGLPEAFQAQAPIVLAEIALVEGPRMIARVVTSDAETIASGGEVELVAADRAADFPLPTFRLA